VAHCVFVTPEYTVPDDAVQEMFPALTQVKVAQGLVFAFIGVLGIVYALANGGAAVPSGLAVTLGAAWLVVCSARMGVVLTKTSVHVYGWFWFRRDIPRANVLEVTDGFFVPTLRWRGRRGIRRTPLSAFYQGTVTPQRLNDRNISRLNELRTTLLPEDPNAG
jgi:hypothetical protein